MSGVEEIEAEEFDDAVKYSNVPVALEFWRRSCGFCQRFKQVYERLPGLYAGRVRFLKVNMMSSIDNLRLAEEMGVEQTPTTKVFCGGEETGELVGFKTLEEAVDELDAILESNDVCIS